MGIKIYIKDNETGIVHEYGTNQHDALIVNDNGSLHYKNIQRLEGTDGGVYSFCNSAGETPLTRQDYKQYGCEPYLDIGGECDINRKEYCLECKHLSEFLFNVNLNYCSKCVHGNAMSYFEKKER